MCQLLPTGFWPMTAAGPATAGQVSLEMKLEVPSTRMMFRDGDRSFAVDEPRVCMEQSTGVNSRPNIINYCLFLIDLIAAAAEHTLV